MSKVQSSKTDFYCFIHIEKCAGTTFSHSLKYNLPFYLSLKPWYYWSNLEGNYFTSKELKRLKQLFPLLVGIGGHTTRTFLNYNLVINREIKYFTFVREPIDRYLSHYYHQVHKMKIPWTIEEFIAEDRFNNYMTCRIAGKNDVALAIEFIENDYSFVGIFEEFNRSLVLLSQFVFNGRITLNYELKNPSSYKKKSLLDFPINIQERIMNNNKSDIELYNHIVHNIFPNYVAKYEGDLKRDIKSFEDENENFKFNKLRYYLINSTRLVTEKIIEPIAHLNR